jgi:hypothetical protein
MNLTEELVDSIMAKVDITSNDNTITVTGSGTREIDLSVNITAIADSIANNFHTTILGDTILNYINNNYIVDTEVYVTSPSNTVYITGSGTDELTLDVNIEVIADSLVNNETFITNLGNELVTNETFITNLGDTIMNHFSNNLTEEFVDSVLSNLNVEGDYGINIERTSPSDIRVQLPQGQSPSDILVWDTVNKVWKPETQAPVWFYMPSIVIDVTNSVTDTTINLHAEYMKQFDLPTSGNRIVGSAPLVNTFTKVYTASELDYYVIGYDETVFTIHDITPAGVMRFSINSSNVSDETFMNIVFVVK